MARRSGYIYALGFAGDGSLISNIITSNVTSANNGQISIYKDQVSVGGTPNLTFINSKLSIQGDLEISGVITSNLHAPSFNGDGLQLTNTSDVAQGTYGSEIMIPQIIVNKNGRIDSIEVNKVKLSLDDVSNNGNYTSNIKVENLVSNSIITQTIYTDGLNIKNTSDVCAGIYGGGLTIPQITVSPNGRISNIQNSCLNINFDQIAEFSNETITYFNFNNSLGIQGNINWSDFTIGTNKNNDLSISSNTPDKTICIPITVKQIINNIKLTDNDTFKWYTIELSDEITIELPSNSKVGSWIGFTNLSSISNVILKDLKIILPSNDLAGVSCRMLCISENRWICS